MIFRWGAFTSNAGLELPFKIDCDALDDDDWACLARIVARQLTFGEVEGVPRGGLRFAEALRPLATEGPLLIVDDVLTTGGSMERQRAGRHAHGVVVVSRLEPVPDWITPILRLDQRWLAP